MCSFISIKRRILRFIQWTIKQQYWYNTSAWRIDSVVHNGHQHTTLTCGRGAYETYQTGGGWCHRSVSRWVFRKLVYVHSFFVFTWLKKTNDFYQLSAKLICVISWSIIQNWSRFQWPVAQFLRPATFLIATWFLTNFGCLLMETYRYMWYLLFALKVRV